MTYKHIDARRTAADFRAHLAAPGVTLPFDETPLQPASLSHRATFRYYAETIHVITRWTDWMRKRNAAHSRGLVAR